MSSFSVEEALTSFETDTLFDLMIQKEQGELSAVMLDTPHD